MRSSSSRNCSSSLGSSITSVFAWRSCSAMMLADFSSATVRWRIASSAALRATRKSQPAGLSGMPECGQLCNALSNASCTTSSARSRCSGPSTRVKYATICPARLRNRWATMGAVLKSLEVNFSLLSRNHRIHFPNLDGSSVFEAWATPGLLASGRVVGRLDQKISTQHFFGFAVRAVGDPNLAFAAQHFAGFVHQFMAANQKFLVRQFLSPRDIFLDDLLHLFWTHIHPVCRIVIKQEHVLRHGFSYRTRVYWTFSVNFGFP